MKIPSLLFIVPLFGITSVNATCFTTGLDGDRTWAHNEVGRMCLFLAGDYAPGQAKHHAFTYIRDALPLNKESRWDFWVTNTGSATKYNSWEGCVEFLNREIDCLKGDETTYPTLGWRFQ